MLKLWRQIIRPGGRTLSKFRLPPALGALPRTAKTFFPVLQGPRTVWSERRFLMAIPRGLLGIALFCCLPPCLTVSATFTASLDRDTLTLGESANLTLTFQGFQGGSAPPTPSLPVVPNLQIAYAGPFQQRFEVNGQVTVIVSHHYTVAPSQAGDFIIPSIMAVVDGARLATQPLKLKVLKPGVPSPEAINSGSQAAFLKLVLPRQEIFLGEAMVAQIQIYVHDGVGLSGLQPPQFAAEGFNVSQVQVGAQRNAQIGRTVYRVVPLEFALKPVKTGRLTFGPVTLTAVLELPSRNGRRDPFEEFGFRSLFSTREQKQVVLATETTNLLSVPFPTQNVPPSFNGAVGNYKMTVTAGPTNLTAGDPITVRVQIAGRGALDGVVLPEQPAWRDFKTLPPTAKPVEARDRFGLEGAKTFEQIVVPQSADIKELPPFAFSFFDPEAKSYRTLVQPAVPLVVRPGASTPAPTVAANRAAQDSPPPTQDIVHIKPRLGVVAQFGPPLLARPWFLVLQGLPVLAWAFALVWRRRADAFAHNPRLRRRRQVARLIRDGLVELRRLAAENKSDEFFGRLFHLLQEQVGERLDLPASAITEAVVDEHLRPRGVPETVMASVRELFQACNLARYAPVRTSQELAAVIPKLEGALRQLQALET